MVKETDTMIWLPILRDLTYREWHAVVNGFYVGLTAYKDKNHEYTREKAYWRGGFILGWAVKTAVILYTAKLVL